jgi:HTH-type transcriptional regulator / antitoxin HipB
MAMTDDPPTSALAEQVRARRRALGLRQQEVADLAGCSERFVLSLERGKTSVQLAKVLDVLRVLGLGLEVGPGNGTITAADRTEPSR